MSSSNVQPTTVQQPTQTPLNVCSEDGLKVVEHDFRQGMKEQLSSDLLFYVARLEEVQAKECPLLVKTNPDLYERYQKIIAETKWYLFLHMGPGHVERLFADHLEFFFAKPWDEVVRGLRVILIAQGDWATRDAIKARFRNALTRSKVHIGTESIMVAGLEKQPPTVGNWLRDFRDSLGDNPITPLSLVEYLNTNTNIGGRTDIRAKVEHLLKLYFELSKSSQTEEGAEEQIMFSNPITGTYQVWEHGTARDTGMPLPAQHLRELRAMLGVDHSGRVLSYAQLVRRTIAEERKELEKQEAQNVLPKELQRLTPPKDDTPPAVIVLPKPETSPPLAKSVTLPPMSTKQIPAPVVPKPLPVVQPVPHTAPYNKISRPMKQSAKITPLPQSQPIPVRPIPQSVTNEPIKPTYTMAEEQMAQHKKWDRLTGKHEEQNSGTPEIEDMLASTSPIFETALRPKRPSAFPSVNIAPSAIAWNERLGTMGPMRKTNVVTDVLPPPQRTVMNPIEELARLDITEFRRFSSDPVLAAQKIVDKLTLLEQDSISKKADGIDAYYSSPLHQAYLAIGNISLDQSRPIADVIQEQRAAGENTLQKEEFDAIADLNRKLRF